MTVSSPADARVKMRPGRAAAPGPRGGGVYLSQAQRTRLLDAAIAIAAEQGYKRMTVRRVTGLAGMSSKTFYDLFEDCEDCFLAAFSEVTDRLAVVMAPRWEGEGEWVERVRCALVALLGSLEREPALGRIVFLEALGAGPRVLARRAEVLDRVAELLEQGRAGSPLADVLPSLTAAGVAGASFGLIHARLTHDGARDGSGGVSGSDGSGRLMELVGPLMATIVLPYRGHAASTRELTRPAPAVPSDPSGEGKHEGKGEGEGILGRSLPAVSPAAKSSASSVPAPALRSGVDRSEGEGVADRSSTSAAPVPARSVPVAGSLGSLEIRVTNRTYLVLAAVAKLEGPSNRQIAELARVSSAGQASMMLSRLEEQGLLANTGAQRAGRRAKQWRLTPKGEEVLYMARPGKRVKASGIGQRARLCWAAVAAVDEHGYNNVTVAHIATWAKISRRTFYELFADRDDCLLAVLKDADRRLTAELQAADLDGLSWRERIRTGLSRILYFFDREPALARFCVVQSARGDERMLAYREEILMRIAAAIGEGSQQSPRARECSPLTAEGLAGAAVSILNTRLKSQQQEPLSDLLGELMSLIVLPYLGPATAARERTRPAPAPSPVPTPAFGAGRAVPASASTGVASDLAPLIASAGKQSGGRYLVVNPDISRGAPVLQDIPIRLTQRTVLVLEAIAEQSGLSNIQVAQHAGITDPGQVSRLLTRLQTHQLIHNTGRGQTRGAANQWRLTPQGQQLEHSIRTHTADHSRAA